jgi:hypothetical protein
MTTVIHIKDTPPGYKNNTDYVYIGRGSKWGNPYHVRMGRSECIAAYRKHLLSRPDLMGALHELKGKTLVCFCKPLDCHGDVLRDLAEAL